MTHGNLGRKCSEEHKRKVGLANSNEKHGQWKGDNVGDKGLHKWVRRHLPEPEFCEYCFIKPPHDLANITGIYNRDFMNWSYLCRGCHMNSDGRMKRLIDIRRSRIDK